MKRSTDPEVVIIRSAYQTEALWLASIASALKLGRRVRAIDAAGRVSEPQRVTSDDDW
jgi:hypothetical protein